MGSMYDRIAELCKAKGISPSAMCDAIGIRRAFMSELKSGRTKKLSAEKTAMIADYLGTTSDYLITGEEKHRPLWKDIVIGSPESEAMIEQLERIRMKVSSTIPDTTIAADPLKEQLWEATKDMSQEEIRTILNIIKAIKGN